MILIRLRITLRPVGSRVGCLEGTGGIYIMYFKMGMLGSRGGRADWMRGGWWCGTGRVYIAELNSVVTVVRFCLCDFF